MKSLITYYSYSGNTDKAAQVLAKALKARGEVVIQRLRPKEELNSFFAQCMAAFTRKRADLKEGVIFDASPYDFILLGSPVWAFAPTPAINTYLDKISGLNGKRVLILLTSGSGVGVNKCFGNIKNVLKDKGASKIDELNISARRVGDEDFVVSCFEKLL